MRPMAGAHVPPAAPRPPDADDVVLTQVLDGFTAQVREAAVNRGGGSVDDAALRTQAIALIDEPDQKRVLWVDDHPENNRYEIAALAKLQIDVQQVTSTSAAMKTLDEDRDGFDMVISDWGRPWDGPGAGLRLLSKLKQRSSVLPVVFYHGEFDPAARTVRAQQALAAGALGEAVYPAELIALVVKGL
jgi:CheY-like chemotaxis protein